MTILEKIIQRFPEVFRGNRTTKGEFPICRYTLQGVRHSLGLDPQAHEDLEKYQIYFSGVARDVHLGYEERMDALYELFYLDGGVESSNLLLRWKNIQNGKSLLENGGVDKSNLLP